MASRNHRRASAHRAIAGAIFVPARSMVGCAGHPKGWPVPCVR
ncbi:MAG: ash family protein [Candidatus Competibacteraceae bacterium]|nr:ash family protein [Candidatus Competibacteraceae bacterium]